MRKKNWFIDWWRKTRRSFSISSLPREFFWQEGSVRCPDHGTEAFAQAIMSMERSSREAMLHESVMPRYSSFMQAQEDLGRLRTIKVVKVAARASDSIIEKKRGLPVYPCHDFPEPLFESICGLLRSVFWWKRGSGDAKALVQCFLICPIHCDRGLLLSDFKSVVFSIFSNMHQTYVFVKRASRLIPFGTWHLCWRGGQGRRRQGSFPWHLVSSWFLNEITKGHEIHSND